MNIADTIAESHTLSRRARPLPIQDSYIFHNDAFGGRTMIRRGGVDTLLQWSSTDTQGDERDAPGPVSFAAVLHLATEEKGRASERASERGRKAGVRARARERERERERERDTHTRTRTRTHSHKHTHKHTYTRARVRARQRVLADRQRGMPSACSANHHQRLPR